MIMATVQSEKGGENITAKDGRLLTGDEAQEVVNAILHITKDISVRDKGERIWELNNGQLFCTLYRHIQDSSGRVSTALVVWEKNTSDTVVQQTLAHLNLSFEQWQKMRDEYQSKQQRQGRRNVILCVGVLAAVAGGIWLLSRSSNSNVKETKEKK